MAYSHIKISDDKLKKEVLDYFVKLYRSSDKKNRNKFKVGRVKFNDNMIEVYIYGNPRHVAIDYHNDIEKATEFMKGVELGSFRICWMVNADEYKYIDTSHKLDAFDMCDYERPILIETKHKTIVKDGSYDNIKSSLIKYVDDQHKILQYSARFNK